MTNPFYNERERRLRAFWRVFFQFLIFFGAQALLALPVSLAFTVTSGGGSIEELVASPYFFAVVGGVIPLVAAFFSVWVAGRLLDRRPILDFGLRVNSDWWLDFGFGLFLGAVLMLGLFLVELAAGWVAVTGAFEPTEGAAFFPAILAPLVLFICVGISEELVSRGYQLKNIAEGLDYPSLGGAKGAIFLAWVLSSLFFGLLHLGNPNATLLSSLNIAFAGILLGVGYVLTGQLAIPIGLHMTWNFFQGNVFGFPVSGLEPIGATVLSTEQGGPPLFTGGLFGPEAGLLGLIAMVVGILLTWLWVRARYGRATFQASLAKPPAPEETRTPGGSNDVLSG